MRDINSSGGIAPKGDIVDWLIGGHTEADLLALVDSQNEIEACEKPPNSVASPSSDLHEAAHHSSRLQLLSLPNAELIGQKIV